MMLAASAANRRQRLLEMMRQRPVDAGIATAISMSCTEAGHRSSCRNSWNSRGPPPQPEVLQTEQTFDLQVGETK